MIPKLVSCSRVCFTYFESFEMVETERDVLAGCSHNETQTSNSIAHGVHLPAPALSRFDKLSRVDGETDAHICHARFQGDRTIFPVVVPPSAKQPSPNSLDHVLGQLRTDKIKWRGEKKRLYSQICVIVMLRGAKVVTEIVRVRLKELDRGRGERELEEVR